MNKYEKELDRIKKNVIPDETWTADDMEHYKTVIEALEMAAKNTGAEWKKQADLYICSHCNYPVEYETIFCPCCGKRMFEEVQQIEHNSLCETDT